MKEEEEEEEEEEEKEEEEEEKEEEKKKKKKERKKERKKQTKTNKISCPNGLAHHTTATLIAGCHAIIGHSWHAGSIWEEGEEKRRKKRRSRRGSIAMLSLQEKGELGVKRLLGSALNHVDKCVQTYRGNPAQYAGL